MYSNHKWIRIISPNECNSSPKVQSFYEQECAINTGNAWDKAYCTRRNHEILYRLHLKIKNPLNIHEILEWPLQTHTWMVIFHPRNWPRQETSHPPALSIHKCKFCKWSKYAFIIFSWNLESFQYIYGLKSFQYMNSKSSWKDIPKNATCTTIPSLPLPPNYMWKHISFPNSLERPLGAIVIPKISYMSYFILHIWFFL